MVENDLARPPMSAEFGRYIHVAHSCVVAARLVPSLAAQFGFAIMPGSADLLVGDQLIINPLFASFEVVAECPAKERDLRSALRDADVAPQFVRAAGSKSAARSLFEKLNVGSGREGAIFLVPDAKPRRAVVAIRARKD